MRTAGKGHCNSQAASASSLLMDWRPKLPPPIIIVWPVLTLQHCQEALLTITASPLSSHPILLRLWNTSLVLYRGWAVQEGKEILSGSLPVLYSHLWCWLMLIFDCYMLSDDSTGWCFSKCTQVITAHVGFLEVRQNSGACINKNANGKSVR